MPCRPEWNCQILSLPVQDYKIPESHFQAYPIPVIQVYYSTDRNSAPLPGARSNALPRPGIYPGRALSLYMPHPSPGRIVPQQVGFTIILVGTALPIHGQRRDS